MKRFFAKASKPFAPNDKSLDQSATSLADVSGHTTTGMSSRAIALTTGLQPRYTVPPVPHPYPYDHLAFLATKDGLLIRPRLLDKDGGTAGSHVRISWGKVVTIEEVNDSGSQYDWSESAIVYGIVGTLELYSNSYILAITSRAEVGNVLDKSHTVYAIKGVTAIPLLEERARTVIKLISSRNAALQRPSLLPRTSTTDSTAELVEPDQNQLVTEPSTDKPYVQFSAEPDLKRVTPTNVEFEDDVASAGSTSSSGSNITDQSAGMTPVFKALATRLSFWSRATKRGTNDPRDSLPMEPPQTTIEEQETLDKIMEAKEEPSEAIETILATTAPAPATTEERNRELEEKVVRECIRELTKGGMYFSYTFDLTRSLQHKQEQIAKSQKEHDLLAGLGALPSPEADVLKPRTQAENKISPTAEPYLALPLWRRTDKQYWWNEWMSRHFIDVGLHSYILPITQGYFQVARFAISPEVDDNEEECWVDYIIISRRSRDRAGLRYQRRGIDEDARVANFVETETIMRVEREGKENTFSYVQIRGSIPLFWKQSGYGLKPPPVLAADRTPKQNLDTLRRHFQLTIPSYGPHTIINLAEQQGKEAAITHAYRDYVKELGLQDVQYCEYDFHAETKGMKYENISKLINAMERVFDAQGFLWISDNTLLSQQKGVFRVNCIDCLDRTNVVQSAFARYVMNRQLRALALLDPSSTKQPEIDFVFNDVWANNGDAISRAYAGTSALKGDFTRTGKRDLSGLLNDGVNSLARMYTSTFSDWFSQAVIDFMLGNRTLSVFSEFLLKLQSSDPRDLIRLSKIRTEAIATSVSRVLPESERLHSGWTLFSPEELNTKIGMKFEEKVLLLSNKALYIVSYDYTLEKVKLYTRVPLGDIVGIRKGAYILSPLEEASRDPEQNAGFVVIWINANQESRVSSYSLRNSFSPPSSPPTSPQSATSLERIPTLFSPPLRPQSSTLPRKPPQALSSLLVNSALASTGTGERTFAAFKALPLDPARIRRESSTGGDIYTEPSEEVAGASSCREVVDRIVGTIRRACEDVGVGQGNFVTREDVVSLAEAQRTTSMYAKMEYGVKRLLWLGAS